MDGEHEEIASTLPKDLDALPRLGRFRLRGMEITRLETFIDAVFAFAITMLVIAAQQIPDDIETLLAAFKNVPVFVASIIVLGIFCRGHWLWSRRYGLEDGISITLYEVTGWAIPVCVGIISFVLAMILPRELIDWSGWVYFSMAVLVPLHSAYRKRRIHTLADLRRATRSADMKASH
jgi:hypothetical protein